jgi:hypothetical protein
MRAGPIERGWAEFVAVAVSADADPDAGGALELAFHAGAAHALALVARRIEAGATAATLGPVLLAWADEILDRAERLAVELLEEEGNGARGCHSTGSGHG